MRNAILYLFAFLALSFSALAQRTTPGNLTVSGKLVVNDSARVENNAIINGTATIKSTATINGAATVNANTTVNGQLDANAYSIDSSQTLAVNTSQLTALDTVNLGTGKLSWVKLRGKSGAVDSVTTFTGGVTNMVYIFSPVADDTTVVLIDGSNIKSSGAITLDALTDRVMFWFDGTNLIQISGVVNND